MHTYIHKQTNKNIHTYRHAYIKTHIYIGTNKNRKQRQKNTTKRRNRGKINLHTKTPTATHTTYRDTTTNNDEKKIYFRTNMKSTNIST